MTYKKTRGFDNSLYADAADAYHAFVEHYDLTPFKERLSVLFNNQIKDFSTLELGAGTGIFTVPLSDLAYQIDAIEYSENQVKILKEAIGKNNIQNVNIILGDANSPRDLINGQSYDRILFSFSLDNISGKSVYESFNSEATDSLIKSYMSYLRPNGKIIVIGSMPEDTILAEKRGLYNRYREEQFGLISKYPNSTIEVIDYAVRFSDHEEALNTTSVIAGRETAEKMLRDRATDVNLKAYIATFSSDIG